MLSRNAFWETPWLRQYGSILIATLPATHY